MSEYSVLCMAAKITHKVEQGEKQAASRDWASKLEMLAEGLSAYDINRVECSEEKAHQSHAAADLGDSPLSSAAIPVT